MQSKVKLLPKTSIFIYKWSTHIKIFFLGFILKLQNAFKYKNRKKKKKKEGKKLKKKKLMID